MRIDQCYFGDCRDSMRAMIAAGGRKKVQTIVTSPPYWGLRDYHNPPGIWGGDPACEHAFDMERAEYEHRTGLGLADLGEKYAGGGHKQGQIGTIVVEQGTCLKCGAWRGALGHEPTPQLFVDHLVEVFRHTRDLLADDGTLWLNLGDSYVANRGYQVPSTKSETKHGPAQANGGSSLRVPVGLKPKDLVGIPWRVALALQDDGWYLRQDIIWHKPNPMPESVADRCAKAHEYLFLLSKSDRYYFDNEAIKEPARRYTGLANQDASGFKSNGKHASATVCGNRGSKRNSFARRGVTKDSADVGYAGMRNKRSVWTVAIGGYSGAHFAVFPPALIEPCILAGSRPGDIVLDPFLGSGTTAQVAQALGRHWVGCELNQDYSSLQDARTRQRAFCWRWRDVSMRDCHKFWIDSHEKSTLFCKSKGVRSAVRFPAMPRCASSFYTVTATSAAIVETTTGSGWLPIMSFRTGTAVATIPITFSAYAIRATRVRPGWSMRRVVSDGRD